MKLSQEKRGMWVIFLEVPDTPQLECSGSESQGALLKVHGRGGHKALNKPALPKL